MEQLLKSLTKNENTSYIISTCTSTDIGLGLCKCEKCTADSQFLSNKCIDNHCAFNNATPIEHCEDHYYYETLTGTSSRSVVCGKPDGDTCDSNNKCSSLNCYESKCGENKDRPNDSESTTTALIRMMLFILIFIAVIGVCIGFICCSRRNNEPSKMKQNISTV